MRADSTSSESCRKNVIEADLWLAHHHHFNVSARQGLSFKSANKSKGSNSPICPAAFPFSENLSNEPNPSAPQSIKLQQTRAALSRRTNQGQQHQLHQIPVYKNQVESFKNEPPESGINSKIVLLRICLLRIQFNSNNKQASHYKQRETALTCSIHRKAKHMYP